MDPRTVGVNDNLASGDDPVATWFRVAPALLAIINFEGRFELASPGWVETLGWSDEELKRLPIWELIHPDDLPKSMEVAKQFMESGGALVNFSNRYRCKDGSYKHLSWSNYADVPAGRVHCVARDITGVAGEADELLKLFSLTNDLIAIGPGKGRYDILSPSWTTLLGWSIEELKNMDVGTLIHPDDYADAMAQAEDMRQTRAVTRDFGARFRCKDGSYRTLSWTAYWDEVSQRTYGIGRDVTALQNQTELIDEQARAWEAFAYTLAHDVRSPVRSICGLADLLKRGSFADDREQVDRCLDMIRARAREVDAMTTKLLGFATSGGAALEIEELDMQQVILHAVDLARETYDAAMPTVRVGPLPACKGDRTLIQQAVGNLIQNSCKYVQDANAEMAVTADVAGGFVAYKFADNGIGFSEDAAKRIWNPLVRAAGDHRADGAGLGLATVKRIIEHHGGHVDCEGREGRGATFVITLPIA